MTGPRTTVVGSLNADLTIPVDHLPEPGETVLSVGPSQLSFGGKGGNQAAAAAAFGGDVAMVGRVGADDFGGQIRADLSGRGIDVTRVISVPEARTGSAVVAVDQRGENLIVVDPGANSELRPADVAEGVLNGAAIVLAQLEIPLDTVAAVVAAGVPVVLNAAPAMPLASSLLDRVSVLVVNATELAMLAGTRPPATPEAALPLARRLHRDVVVTLGEDGALVVPRRPARPVHIPAPTVEIRDATGAGDCFCGTLAVLLAEGAELANAAHVAVAAATLSATASGARGKLPSRGEASALAAGLNIREVG